MKASLRKDGRWRCKVTIDGKVNYVYGKSEKECLDNALLLKSNIAEAPRITSNITLKEYLNIWLSNIEPTVRPPTFTSYIQVLRTHIIPTLGSKRIKDITKAQVQKLVSDMNLKNKSPRTIQYAVSLLSHVFKTAIADGFIKGNPCDLVRKPKLAKKRKETLDREQCLILLQSVDNELHHDIIHIALYTGLRREEILALTQDSVDIKLNEIKVFATIVKVDGKSTYTQKTKNESSSRSIVVDDATCSLLQKWYNKAKDAGRQLLFAHEDGSPYNPEFASKFFKKYVTKLGFSKGITFHSLRHTHATLLLENGVHHKVIQSRLGHSTFSTTMDIYSHSSRKLDNEAAKQLSSYLDTD